jgi:fructokinase
VFLMLVIAGEALIDLVIGTDQSVEAALGGAPYNTARAAARLGVDVHFIGCLSTDRFGERLIEQLRADGVHTDSAPRTDLPTTLAAAEIGSTGSATYRFYLDGTSAPALGPDMLRAALERVRASGPVDGSLGRPEVFFTGGLGLVLEPMADSIASAVDGLADGTLLVVDVNCRPSVIGDRARYLDRLRTVLARADVVKASDEDLGYLFPGAGLADAVASVLERGARSVVVTTGARPTLVADRTGSIEVPVRALAGALVDTIGAGDTFGAGMIAWWDAAALGRGDVSIERLASAVAAAHDAAAIVVTRRGADPPYRHELGSEWPLRVDG